MLIRINGAEMKRRYPRDDVDFDSFVEGYIELVCNGLRDPASARGLDENLEAMQ